MRYKSQSRMEEILRFIDRYILENKKSPSIQNIADEIGIAKSLAYKYLLEMRERGMIEYDGTAIRTSVTKKANFTTQMAPILGSIVCGQPEYAEENFEEYVSLPTAIFGFGDFFVLRAWGNSMIDAGIDEGDFVVVRKQNTAKEGNIVVALVGNEPTLKTLKFGKNQRIILHPENKDMEDIYPSECYIQGVAEHIIKSVHNKK